MDTKQIPVMNFATTVVLIVAAILFMINVNRGIAFTTSQLQEMHNYTTAQVAPFEVEGIIYNVVAVLTMCAGIGAMVVDYTLTNDRQPEDIPTHRGHQQRLMSILAMALLFFGAFIGWLWMLHRAIEANFVYRIVYISCTTTAAVRKTYCIDVDMINWARPKNVKLPRNCDEIDRFDRTCVFIRKTYPVYNTVAIITTIIVLCLVNYMMVFGAHFTYFNNFKTVQPLTKASRSTRSLNRQSSNSRSSDWHQFKSNEYPIKQPTPDKSSPKISIRVRNTD